MDTIKRLPTHPGDVLKEELEFRKISQKKFSDLLGVPYTMLNEILNGKRAVSTEYALLFEAALGIDPEPLLKMQSDYNMQVAKADKSFVERLSNIRKLVAML